VARGTLNFLNKQFQLARSSLQFFGASPPAPVLDIRAESREKDLTAVLNIRGDIHSPELVLSSEPALPQDEILARLLFERGAAQISPLQALRLAQAARALSGYGAGGGPNLLGKTGQLLGLDQLGLRGSEEGMEGTKVGAGKYLTEEIYVDYEQGLAERSGKVTVEVEVHPNVTVETEVGTDAGTGIGVNWKLDY
jgi:translocation and assembly module TamB